MKRSGNVKFPNSVQLFKFCQKIMTLQKGSKIRDQEVGAILGFNPSDCSHWKRGEKNVRSVFALAQLAEVLKVEPALIHDVASGAVSLDEAHYEYLECASFQKAFSAEIAHSQEGQLRREAAIKFVKRIHDECEFVTPPLYLPEVMRAFSFVVTQPVEMLDKISRILRIKLGRYCIQFKKGELKPQTRMSMVKDLARIVFEGERDRFPELPERSADFYEFEEILFTANLLLPQAMLMAELSKLDARKNVVSELASLFWVPKSLVCFQLQEIVRLGHLRHNQTSRNQVSTTKTDLNLESI